MSKQAQAMVKCAEAQLAAARAAGSTPLGVAQTVTTLCSYLSAAALSKKKPKKPAKPTTADDTTSTTSGTAAAPAAGSDRRNVMPTEAAAWRVLGDALTLVSGAERVLDMPKATGLVIPLCTLLENIRATLETRDTLPVQEQTQEQTQQQPLRTNAELGALLASARAVLEAAAWRRRFVFHPTPEWAARLAAAAVTLAAACPAPLAADAAACARCALDAFTAVALAHADSALLFAIVLRDLLVPLLAAVAPAAPNSHLAPVAAVALHALVVLPVCSALTGICNDSTSSTNNSTNNSNKTQGVLDARPEAYAATTEPGALVRALHHVVSAGAADAVLGGAAVLYREVVRTVGADATLSTATGAEPAAKRARAEATDDDDAGDDDAGDVPTGSTAAAVAGAGAAAYVRPRSAQELRAIKSRFFLNYAAVFLAVVLPTTDDKDKEQEQESEGDEKKETKEKESRSKADMRMLQVVGEILEATSRDGFLGMVTTRYEAQFFASAADIAVHHILGAMRAADTGADIAAPALVVTQLLRLDHRAVEPRIRQILGALWRCPWPTATRADAHPPPFAPFWHSLVAVYRELRQLDTAFVDLLLAALEDMDTDTDTQDAETDARVGPYFVTYDALVDISDGVAALLHQQALPVLARFTRFWHTHFAPALQRAGGLGARRGALHTRFCALWTCVLAAVQLAAAPPAAATAAIDPVADELRALLAEPPAGVDARAHADLAAVLCALADLRVGLLRATGHAAYADRLLLPADAATAIIDASRTIPEGEDHGKEDDVKATVARRRYTELLLALTACTAVGTMAGAREAALLQRVLAPWADAERKEEDNDNLGGAAASLDAWAETVLPPAPGCAAFYVRAAWELLAQNMGTVMHGATAAQRGVLLARVVRGFLAVDATPAVARALLTCASFYQIPFVATHLVAALLAEARTALAACGNNTPRAVRTVRRVLSACDRVPDVFFAPAQFQVGNDDGEDDDKMKDGHSNNSSVVDDVCAFAVPLAQRFDALDEPGCSEAAAGLFALVCRAAAADTGVLRRLAHADTVFLLNECFARHDYRLLAVWARSHFDDDDDDTKSDDESDDSARDVASAELVAAAQARGVGRVVLYGHLLGGVNDECRAREAARRSVRGCARIVLPRAVAACATDATALLVAEWQRLQTPSDSDTAADATTDADEARADVVVLASELLRFYARVARPLYAEASVDAVRAGAAQFRTVEAAVLDAAVATLRTAAHSAAGARHRLAALHYIGAGISQQQETLTALKKSKSKSKSKSKKKGNKKESKNTQEEEQQQKEQKEQEEMEVEETEETQEAESKEATEEFRRALELVVSVAAGVGRGAVVASETAALRQTMLRLVRVAAGTAERDLCVATCARALADPAPGAAHAGALLLEAVLRANCFVHHDVLRALLALLADTVPRWPPAAGVDVALRATAALVLFAAEHVPALAAAALSSACTVVTGVLANCGGGNLDPNVFAELTRTVHVLLPSEDVCGPALCRTLQCLAAHACRERDEARAVFCAGCVARLMEDLAAHDRRGWAFLYAHQILQAYLSAVDRAGGRARLDAVCRAFLPGVCALLSICNDEQVRRVHYLATAPGKAYLQELRDVYQREFQYKGKA